jgi:hypothetical protein
MLSFDCSSKGTDTRKGPPVGEEDTTTRCPDQRRAGRPRLRATRHPFPQVHALRQGQLPLQSRPTSPARPVPALDPHRRRQDRDPDSHRGPSNSLPGMVRQRPTPTRHRHRRRSPIPGHLQQGRRTAQQINEITLPRSAERQPCCADASVFSQQSRLRVEPDEPTIRRPAPSSPQRRRRRRSPRPRPRTASGRTRPGGPALAVVAALCNTCGNSELRRQRRETSFPQVRRGGAAGTRTQDPGIVSQPCGGLSSAQRSSRRR